MQRIIIVDDNEADQYLTNDAIEEYREDIKVFQVYDGQEALTMLASLPQAPDLLFLDINMPGMGGFEFLEEYQRVSTSPSPVVMLTSSEQQRDRERCLNYPFVKHYMCKPLSANDIEEVESLLSKED